MWKLYDDLCVGIPSGIRITECIIGEKWTYVSANGNIGIARTMEFPGNPEALQTEFAGAYLRDTANHMRWGNLAEASVWVAAMNAWYNTEARAAGLGVSSSAAKELPQETVYICNYDSSCQNGQSETGRKRVFPMPASPDFDETAYPGIKDTGAVVISADALITRALPKLLDIIGEEGIVILEGYSLPCTALFFAFDMPVKELRGFYSRTGFTDALPSCAADSADVPMPGMLPFIVRPA